MEQRGEHLWELAILQKERHQEEKVEEKEGNSGVVMKEDRLVSQTDV